MFTCFIRYEINAGKIDEFKEYARTWISLIEKYGGRHHGFFVPGEPGACFPEAKFSFPGLGVEGPENIAVALFSFQSVEAYETYRKDVVHDPECRGMTARFNANMSFNKYERNFLTPIFGSDNTKRLKEQLGTMSREIVIRTFEEKDITVIVNAFSRHNWPKPRSTFDFYWKEQQDGERIAWVAFKDNEFAGYATLKWQSSYAPFRKKNIPEIMDLNVLPPFRNKGIGSSLLEIAEQEAFSKVENVGLGVGLYEDYGSAIKIYVTRGYVPDGRGVTYSYERVDPGSRVVLDDELVLWFTKKATVDNYEKK